MKYDFTIIGAGVSGATAALVLAGCGFQVALIEERKQTAALVRGFRSRGLHFDTGFHYAGGFAAGESLDLFCRYLGLADRIVKEPLDADGFDTIRCRRPDFVFRFPWGPGRLRERLHETFPDERPAIDAYLREIETACAAFPFVNIGLDPEQLPTVDPRRGETLQELLDRLTGNRLLQSVLCVHTLLHGTPPQEAPFLLHALVVGPYYRSAHSLKGGGKSLAEAFDTELARRGVAVFCGKRAKGILLEGGKVAGVRLADGETVASRGCIFTAHPRILLDLLPETTFRPAYRKRLQGLTDTPSACLLFGGVDALPAELSRGNLFLLDEPSRAGRLDEESPGNGPLYLTAARPAPEKPEGCGFLAITPVSNRMAREWQPPAGVHRPSEYAGQKDRMMRKMRTHLADFLPRWCERHRWCEGATPITLRDYGNSPCGSMYGVSHRAGQIPLHSLTRLPGLFLAGQAVAAPGVMGAMTSAFLACGHIVGHARIWKELRACR